MLCSRVPADAPKDWRRETLKEYLRERHAIFKEDRRNNARGIDDSNDDDVVMEEDNYVIEAHFEEYIYNVITNN